MTTRLTNKLLRLAAVIGCAALAPVAQAAGPLHWNKSDTLGTAATATDIWATTCAATWANPNNGLTENLTGFEARVRDKLAVAAPFMRVKVERRVPSIAAGVQQTDPNSNLSTGDGDAGGVASPFSFIAASGLAANTFWVYVSKSASGSENYEIDFHCLYAGRQNLVNNANHPDPGVPTSIQSQ